MMRDDIVYLQHVVDRITRIETYLAGSGELGVERREIRRLGQRGLENLCGEEGANGGESCLKQAAPWPDRRICRWAERPWGVQAARATPPPST